MKILIAMAALIVSGCSTSFATNPNLETDGKLYASIRLVENVTGLEKRNTGFFFRVETLGGTFPKDILSGYRYDKGKLIEKFEVSDETFAKIRETKLAPFDYADEIEIAGKKELKKEGIFTLYGRDGAKWEIIIITKNGTIQITDWNILEGLDWSSQHSEKLREIKLIIDALALDYGLSQFGT